jgi:hypothetical protein
VLVAALVWPVREAGSPLAPGGGPEPGGTPPVRSSAPAAEGSLVVEIPRDNDRLGPGFEIVWHGPSGAAFYEVQLTTPAGDVLWSTQVDGAMERVTVPMAVPADRPSYIWVTAHLREGRRLTSNVVRVRGRSDQ